MEKYIRTGVRIKFQLTVIEKEKKEKYRERGGKGRGKDIGKKIEKRKMEKWKKMRLYNYKSILHYKIEQNITLV